MCNVCRRTSSASKKARCIRHCIGWNNRVGSKSEWGLTEKNREARFYSLTAQGRKQLALEEESWARFTEGVGRVLRYV